MATPKAALAALQAKFKKSNPDILFDRNKKVEFIPSGNLAFDLNAGGGKLGGFPRSRLSEIFGMEHCGKSSLMFATSAGIQRRKAGVVIFLDFENAFDVDYARNTFGLVVDQETFILITPDNIEEGDAAFEILRDIDNIAMVICDSVDAMKPKALIESSLSDERRVGAQAQAVGRFVAKARKFARETNAAFVFLNQMRTSINTSKFEQNTGTGAGFNPMESYTTPGGLSLRYYCSLRIKLEYGGKIEHDGYKGAAQMGDLIEGEGSKLKARLGNHVKVINIKNKCGTPFLRTFTHFIFPSPMEKGGWSRKMDLIYLLKKRGIIRQAATKFIYESPTMEWSNVGSMADSEAKFFQDRDRTKDAEQTLLNAISGTLSSQEDRAAKLFDTLSQEEANASEAATLTEAVERNVKEGTHAAGSLEVESLDLGEDLPGSESEDQPTSTMSL